MIKSKITRPLNIVDQEVVWDKKQQIVSKTDIYGTILYMNDAFEQSSEYNKMELIGKPHNIIRHPDMPKVVFKILWKQLKKGNNFHAIIKNLTRTGKYYWVITDFSINKNEDGEVSGYTSRRRAVPDSIIDTIAPLYASLLKIEKEKGEKAAELYFEAYLQEEIGKTYDQFVIDLFEDATRENEVKAVEEILNEQPKENNDNESAISKGLKWFFFGD